MATKKAPPARSKTKARASQPAMPKPKLQNLAARPTSFNDESTYDDSMLADTSGVFRVTSALRQRNVADEDFPIAPPPPRDSVEDIPIEDEATTALKRERLRVLAARDAARRR